MSTSFSIRKPASVSQGIFGVEAIEPRVLLAVFTVTSTTDMAVPGSLRLAITDANATPGLDRIDFNIGGGVRTINVGSTGLGQLPQINDPVIVDGRAPAAHATQVIQLNGSGAGANADGLRVARAGAGSFILSLVINRFSDDGIVLSGSGLGAGGGGNSVTGCYIGVDPTGSIDLGNGGDGIEVTSSRNGIGIGLLGAFGGNVISGNGANGIHVFQTTGGGPFPLPGDPATNNGIAANHIGTNAAGTAAIPNGDAGIAIETAGNQVGGDVVGARNIISGNQTYNVSISGTNAGGNVIRANHVGTNETGSGALGGLGIAIFGSPNNTIGGTSAAQRNVISGNGSMGVFIDQATASGNVIQGNYIGTRSTGQSALPNAQLGVWIRSPNNSVGGTVPGARNVISGNGTGGLRLELAAATGNVVQGNYIGLAVNGSTLLGNGNPASPAVNAVAVADGATNNTIGGAAAAARNVIAGSFIRVLLTNRAGGNRVQGNYIGTDATGNAAFAAGAYGVMIDQASNDNVIGGADPGAGNVISGNSAGYGVEVINSFRTQVLGNIIGARADGTAALPNGSGVVILGGSANNVVGGTDPAARNVISGNRQFGVFLVGNADNDQAANNLVQGNYIGTTVSGAAALANGEGGVLVGNFATLNSIGGTADGAGNVISGNGGPGVRLQSGLMFVQGNRVGTNAAGTLALANTGPGILVNSSSNNIGGTDAGAGNLVSGNVGFGIELAGGLNAGDQTIQGNFIGTNAAGARPIPNQAGGISVDSATNRIGGSAPRAGNVISGNHGNGIMFTGANAVSNRVRGNDIGTGADGASDLGNAGSGVAVILGARVNEIGGIDRGEGNVIAFNGGDGVSIITGDANAVARNSIFSNGGLGIDLGSNGVNANDPGDADLGPNDLQNYPVLASAVSGADTRVRGTLDSTPATSFELEFFSSPECDPTAFGEGARLIGVATVTTNAAGIASFDLTFPVAVTPGQVVTATARKPVGSVLGNTSEFSRCVEVAAAPPQVTQVYVAGPWGELFTGYLAAHDMGMAPYGYAVPDGSHELDVLPWNNVNRISISFSQDVQVNAGNLAVRGVNVPLYPLSMAPGSFVYDPATRTATWTLGQAIVNDKVLLDLDGDAPSGVKDATSNALLDGEWGPVGSDTYPSGDGTAGGDFRFRINLLAGDVDRSGRVNALDLSAVKQRLNSTTTNNAGAGYSPFADINGDGRINALDLSGTKQRLNQSLPTAEPTLLVEQ